MSLQMNLPLTLNVTSSPELAGGHSPSDLPNGPMTTPCGQEAAHANLSARQAKERGLLTSGTSGHHSFGSSASVVLRQSLVSKLHQRMGSDGGILFRLTWKERVTPAGQSIFALRESARSTSGKGSTGWPTPQTFDSGNGNTPETWYARQARNPGMSRSSTPTALSVVCQMISPWPTPMAGTPAQNGNSAAGNTDSSLKTLALLGVEIAGHGLKLTQITSLQVMAKTVAAWPTPNTMDTIDRKHMRPSRAATGRQTGYLSEAIASYAAHGIPPSGSPAPTAKRGQLNAAFSRWLMGYLVEWDIAAILAHRQRKTRRKGE